MRKADYFPEVVMPQRSGCVKFVGEDLGEEDRIRQQRAE